MALIFPSIQRLREFKMKPQMTTESADIDERFLMTEDNISFLVLFEHPVPGSIADEGTTRKTDVVQETADDD